MLFILLVIVGAITLFVGVRFKKVGRKHEFAITSAVALLAFVFAFTQTITVIPAGSVGVVDFLGMVSSTTLKPGVNIVNPMARVIKFSIKTQEEKEIMKVPSEEGLTVALQIESRQG